ncbi:MAG: hypothetical protein R2685_07755 [Candidatus Nitrosocosmicus sp.]|nr:hypothetical protein [Candidatus Nitrosocosmicus sp.]
MARGQEQHERTILIKGHFQSFLKNNNLKKKMRGTDVRLYTPDGFKPNDKDAQTVMTLCSNMINPNPKDRKGEEDIDRLIGSALDKILIADRVRSQSESKGTKSVVDKQIIETDITKLENTELDSYVKRATGITRLKNGDLFGRIF